MKTSELLEKLNYVLKEFGDLEVKYDDKQVMADMAVQLDDDNNPSYCVPILEHEVEDLF